MEFESKEMNEVKKVEAREKVGDVDKVEMKTKMWKWRGEIQEARKMQVKEKEE